MKIEGFDWYFRLKKARLLLGFIVMLILMGVAVVIAGDFIKGTPLTTNGVVVSKKHKDAYRSSSGKRRSEKWSVSVKGEKASGSCNVAKAVYESLSEGDKVEISALKGGVTGWTYVRGVKKLQLDSAVATSPPSIAGK